MSASADFSARGLIRARTSEELVLTFAESEPLLAAACRRGGMHAQEEYMAVCEIRGWILDELADRGQLALIDSGFEVFA